MSHATVFALTLATLMAVPAAHASDARRAIADTFDAIAGETADGVRVQVNGNDRATRIQRGDAMSFLFESDQPGYLTVVYLDAHGAATLLFPTADVEDGRIGPEQPVHFPTGFVLEAGLPLGVESLLVVATETPLARSALLARAGDAPLPVLDSPEALALAHQLRSNLADRPSDQVAAVTARHHVVDPQPGGSRYTSRGIVDYFTTRHRSIRRPKLDLNIKFEFGSAVLSDAARDDLDEVGKALTNPRLSGRQFTLIGHTDDIGSDEANQVLSERRATAARDYVLGRFEVAPDTIRFEGRGEREPLIPAEDELGPDSARAQNRRVALELER